MQQQTQIQDLMTMLSQLGQLPATATSTGIMITLTADQIQQLIMNGFPQGAVIGLDFTIVDQNTARVVARINESSLIPEKPPYIIKFESRHPIVLEIVIDLRRLIEDSSMGRARYIGADPAKGLIFIEVPISVITSLPYQVAVQQTQQQRPTATVRISS